MKKDLISIVGWFVMAMAMIYFIYYLLYDRFESVIIAIIFGIGGTILVCLSKENIESAILSILLFLIIGIVSIINVPKILSMGIMIICIVAAIYFVLVPSNKKTLPQNSDSQ
jgi:predicted membrane channel-forming protein YqfA (hemolysin III family)